MVFPRAVALARVLLLCSLGDVLALERRADVRCMVQMPGYRSDAWACLREKPPKAPPEELPVMADRRTVALAPVPILCSLGDVRRPADVRCMVQMPGYRSDAWVCLRETPPKAPPREPPAPPPLPGRAGRAVDERFREIDWSALRGTWAGCLIDECETDKEYDKLIRQLGRPCDAWSCSGSWFISHKRWNRMMHALHGNTSSSGSGDEPAASEGSQSSEALGSSQRPVGSSQRPPLPRWRAPPIRALLRIKGIAVPLRVLEGASQKPVSVFSRSG